MQFPKVSSLFSFSKNLSSASPSKDPQAAPVGASTSQVGGDEYFHQEKFNKWIEETKHKIPHATPLLREEAFRSDPLIKGTIFPYLRNVLLKGYTVQTQDNKLYAAAIKEITSYLEQIDVMQAFREDFKDFAFLTGHTYRRMDPDTSGNIVRLEKIEPSTVEVFNDPWDSSIIAYHQHAKVNTTWSSLGTTEEVDSWFIPYGTDVKDVNATYIQNRAVGNNQNVYDLFEKYRQNYSISNISNLRVAASERVISMHNSERTQKLCNLYEDDDLTTNNPAPIDPVILAIWLKRLLLSNAPHLIYIVINPFLHARSGIIKETKDALGNTSLISSVPQKPSNNLQASNPGVYNTMLQNFTSWVEGLKEAQKKIMECVKSGGVFGSGPDLEIKPVESSRNVSYLFIKNLIDQLDTEIGQAFGFPMALVNATGTELASSRNILQIFNSVHAGERREYETVADKLIRKMFSGRTWKGSKTVKDEKTGEPREVPITYTFEDIQAHFVLDTPDVKDLLQEAQAVNVRADTLNKLKATGASKEDVQALGDEYGFGLLGLDNYQAATSPTEGTPDEGAAQANAVIKAILSYALQEQGVTSASPTDPSGFKDKTITKRLQEAYQTAKETIDQLFEEH